MIEWLKSLPLELYECEEYADPDEELKPTDHIVGDMNENIKKLYTLFRRYASTCNEETVKLLLKSSSAKDEAIPMLSTLHNKARVLELLLWTEVNETFNLFSA